jgi:hypothetical protein
MFDLNWEAAIVGTVHFAIGYGFWRLAQYVPQRIKGNTGKVLSWPCYGLAFIFVSSAIFTGLIAPFLAGLIDIFGPIIAWAMGRS